MGDICDPNLSYVLNHTDCETYPVIAQFGYGARESTLSKFKLQQQIHSDDTYVINATRGEIAELAKEPQAVYLGFDLRVFDGTKIHTKKWDNTERTTTVEYRFG
jgi:hypothetical protein